jgi:RimJ/RimL family protein N-acetyltransferase
MPALLYLYVDDIDATYGRALKAGAVPIEEPQNMPYGDRRGMVKDPCGNIWQIATHRDEISQDGIRPIGPEVPAHAARRPERRVLQGRIVRLEPLDPASHGATLWRETHGSGTEALWQYLFEPPFPDEHAFLAHLAQKAASEDPLYFAILDQASGHALGYATLMRIDPMHRCIEVGNILYGAGLQRRAAGTEAQFLLMRHVFDDLGYRRFEWKCNALNAPSRRAAERFGFTFEGIFRQHMIVKGRNRDTAWYSMIDSEWPKVKQAFEHWLAPENFDAAGRQRQSLESIRIALRAGQS